MAETISMLGGILFLVCAIMLPFRPRFFIAAGMSVGLFGLTFSPVLAVGLFAISAGAVWALRKLKPQPE